MPSKVKDERQLSEDEVAAVKRVVEELRAYRAESLWLAFDQVGENMMVNGVGEQTIYCSAMGLLGQVEGLAAYVGEVGLRSLRLTLETTPAQVPDTSARLSAMLVTGADRAEVSADTRKLLQQAGIKPRGNGNWPNVEAFEPGRPPRFPERAELLLLADLLALVNRVARLIDSDPHAFAATVGKRPKGKSWLVVGAAPPEGATHRYSYSWSEGLPVPAPMPAYELTAFQAKLAERLRVADGKPKIDLECYGFFLPALVREGEYPYIPYALMLVEPRSGLVLGLDTVGGPGPAPAQHVDFILKTLRDCGMAPNALLVCRDEVASMLSGLADALGVPLIRRKSLPTCLKVHRLMIGSQMGRRS